VRTRLNIHKRQLNIDMQFGKHKNEIVNAIVASAERTYVLLLSVYTSLLNDLNKAWPDLSACSVDKACPDLLCCINPYL